MSGPIFAVTGAVTSVRVLVLCLALLSTPVALADKNMLFKCVTAAGVTSIQSDACPAGSIQAWRRAATPEPAPTPEQAAQADAKRLRDQQTVRELSEIVEKKLQPPPPTPAAPTVATAANPAGTEAAAVDACQAAQSFAGAVREKDWMGLTDDQVRRLYGWVAEQCKAPGSAN